MSPGRGCGRVGAVAQVETHVYLWEGHGEPPSANAAPPDEVAAHVGGQAPSTLKGLKLLAVGQGVHKRLGALRAL